eukprot:CAMPEP_0113665696 /NCGR_PEP_ID=MMETSP0038_2-20120614/2447_1 /TAXON_ID=2898 /ORGANISM="Cryptomonas paramecium" /LENGTH=60 /DNA_ID=CAMNT_0000581075 /DNA_START=110 /DNA_END=292 /DNA_ORIENTATION=+ /assembly_acc=CAM_ASM_000170
MDANGDKMLTKEEVRASLKTAGCPPEQIEAMVTQMFNDADKNKDGVLTLDELLGAVEKYA